MYVIQPELVKALLNYLNSRPHGEVRGLFDALQQLMVLEAPVVENKDK